MRDTMGLRTTDVGLALLELIALMLPAVAVLIQLGFKMRTRRDGHRWTLVTAGCVLSFVLLGGTALRIVRKLGSMVPYWSGEVGILAIGIYVLGLSLVPVMMNTIWDAGAWIGGIVRDR